jgi:predicted enzyme related to lactoylglutathione lyase
MIKKVAFTMYPVLDIERARNFYEQILGLKLSSLLPAPNGKWVEYDLPGGGCFAITDMVKEVRPASDSGGSIAFEVENLDSLIEDLKEKDVKFKLDAFSTPVCKMAVVFDSEGNALILHQLTKK